VRIRLGGADAVHVSVNVLADHPGQYFGVPDFEVSPSAVVVVLARAGEVDEQDLVPGRGRADVFVLSLGLGLCLCRPAAQAASDEQPCCA
jgi:hypothetical protein